MKRIGADRMHHLAFIDRIGQMRGVSEFASVLTRIEDLKDYEESERIAAKIAASMTAYVKRTSPEGFDPAGIPDSRKDESGNIIKKYINETLIPAVLTDDATEESRKQAEAARVAAQEIDRHLSVVVGVLGSLVRLHPPRAAPR